MNKPFKSLAQTLGYRCWMRKIFRGGPKIHQNTQPRKNGKEEVTV